MHALTQVKPSRLGEVLKLSKELLISECAVLFYKGAERTSL